MVSGLVALRDFFPPKKELIGTEKTTCYNNYEVNTSFITVRKRSSGQGNIFSSVCQEFCSRGGSASVHAGISPSDQAPPPPEQTPLLPSACWEIRSTSGRYASYWNAILFSDKFENFHRFRIITFPVIKSYNSKKHATSCSVAASVLSILLTRIAIGTSLISSKSRTP